MIDTGEECRVELKTTMLKHYLSKEQLEVLGEELRPFMEDFTKLKLEFAIGHGIRRYLRDGFIKAHIDGEGEGEATSFSVQIREIWKLTGV